MPTNSDDRKGTALQKRLGQYFSGDRVASLLIGLASPGKSDTVIDPMAGAGDMLAAAERCGIPQGNLYGVEIDPGAAARCKDRLPEANTLLRDAFSQGMAQALGRSSWDLVITNPPYVRYQSLEASEDEGIVLQSAEQTRENLLKILRENADLREADREVLCRVASSYSGLSDLAVPSWILCASLVKEGGTLAMVVPEAWISREYALPVKYMLLRCFDIQYVAEDVDRVWFPQAQVKTNLIVAKRVGIKVLAEWETGYRHLRLRESCAGPDSLVERFEHSGGWGEGVFWSLARRGKPFESPRCSLHIRSTADYRRQLLASSLAKKLLGPGEGATRAAAQKVSLPAAAQKIGLSAPACPLAAPDAWGLQIGQGLRTGANRFFYTKFCAAAGEYELHRVDALFSHRVIALNSRYTLPVLRYQSDLGSRLVAESAHLEHRLLYLRREPAAEEGPPPHGADLWLHTHIEQVQAGVFQVSGREVRFPELSAVRPNSRPDPKHPGQFLRRWYMLPALTPRHLPDLCIPRVNHREVRCCFVQRGTAAVDANFSTLWVEESRRGDLPACLALLNSTWVKVQLEEQCTVMGGGALKVEAVQLKKLVLPTPVPALVTQLNRWGTALLQAGGEEDEILREVDRLLLGELTGRNEVDRESAGLREYLKARVKERDR